MESQEPAHNRVNEAIDRLTDEFSGRCSSETVREFVVTSFEAFRGSRIVDFVPLLVYKSARERLGAQTRSVSAPAPADSTH